jgi:ketosteroid isomerase-like protein
MDSASVSEQIQECIGKWADAELHSDLGALNQMLNADFSCVGPAGFVIDKEQYLGPRRSGDLTTRALSWDCAKIRAYGDTAVAIGTQTQQSSFQGRDSSGRLRATQVLVHGPGGWGIVSYHLSPIAPAPPVASRCASVRSRLLRVQRQQMQ